VSSPFSLRSRRQAETSSLPQQRQLATVSANGTDGNVANGEATQATTASAEPEKAKASEQSKIDGFWSFLGAPMQAALELIKSKEPGDRELGLKMLKTIMWVFTLLVLGGCGTLASVVAFGGTLSAGNLAVGVGTASAGAAIGKGLEAAKGAKADKDKS